MQLWRWATSCSPGLNHDMFAMVLVVAVGRSPTNKITTNPFFLHVDESKGFRY